MRPRSAAHDNLSRAHAGGCQSGRRSVASPCTPGGACDPGLTCASQVCVRIGVDSGSEASTDASDEPEGLDAACGKLFPTDGNIFCPFQSLSKTTCTAVSQECCIPPTGSSTCESLGSACPADASVVFQCDDSKSCPPAQSCFGSGRLVQDGGCLAVENFAGTFCRSQASNGEFPICASNDCASGKTCTPFRIKTVNLGACF